MSVNSGRNFSPLSVLDNQSMPNSSAQKQKLSKLEKVQKKESQFKKNLKKKKKELKQLVGEINQIKKQQIKTHSQAALTSVQSLPSVQPFQKANMTGKITKTGAKDETLKSKFSVALQLNKKEKSVVSKPPLNPLKSFEKTPNYTKSYYDFYQVENKASKSPIPKIKEFQKISGVQNKKAHSKYSSNNKT